MEKGINFIYFKIRTGHFACWETAFATLPRSILSNPLLPCEPMTIRSILLDFEKDSIDFAMELVSIIFEENEIFVFFSKSVNFVISFSMDFFCFFNIAFVTRESKPYQVFPNSESKQESIVIFELYFFARSNATLNAWFEH